MIGMIRTIRDKLRDIRRHSATRRRTPLTNIRDTVFVVSLLVAIPVAMMFELWVQRDVSTSFVTGHLYENPDGTMLVVIEGRAGAPEFQHPWGAFSISLEERRRGWPVPAAVWRRPAQILINAYDESTPRRAEAGSPDPIVRAVVETTLTAGHIDPAMIDALRTGRSSTDRSWLKTLFSVATWWVLLNFVGTFLGSALYLLVHVFRVKRGVAAEAREARGLCPKCGYDMRGLEFSARCPECGKLMY